MLEEFFSLFFFFFFFKLFFKKKKKRKKKKKKKEKLVTAMILWVKTNTKSDQLSKAFVTKFVDHTFEEMEELLLSNGVFTWNGFGSFKVRPTAERNYRNPLIKDRVVLINKPAGATVRFTPSPRLKALANDQTTRTYTSTRTGRTFPGSSASDKGTNSNTDATPKSEVSASGGCRAGTFSPFDPFGSSKTPSSRLLDLSHDSDLLF